jgi:hypothetical protein
MSSAGKLTETVFNSRNCDSLHLVTIPGFAPFPTSLAAEHAMILCEARRVVSRHRPKQQMPMRTCCTNFCHGTGAYPALSCSAALLALALPHETCPEMDVPCAGSDQCSLVRFIAVAAP